MSTSNPAEMPAVWRAIADAVRRAAAEGAVVASWRDLAALAGLSPSGHRPVGAVRDMLAAGVLLVERREQQTFRFGLPTGEWTAWPEDSIGSATQAILAAIRRAAGSGKGMATKRSLGIRAGLPASQAETRVDYLCERGVLRREQRERSGGGVEISWLIVAENVRSPWCLMPVRGLGVKGEGSGALSGRDLMQRVGAAKSAHLRRLEGVPMPSEAEIRAMVDRHIAERGVKRAPPPPQAFQDGPAPVRGRGRPMAGDGVYRARGV